MGERGGKRKFLWLITTVNVHGNRVRIPAEKS
jgi:hypothetical protein